MKKHKISIIGWTDWFWKWLAIFLVKNFGEKISLTFTWRDSIKAEKMLSDILKNHSKNQGNIEFTTDNISAVKESDITIFAVPIAYMEQSIKEIAPHLQPNSVVADVCSVKVFPSETLREYAPDSVLVIPTHPMFGPFVQSIAWQIFVLTVEESVKEDSRYCFFKEILKESWARILETSPWEHDKMMAVVQWLTHFDFFVFWETIKRLWVDIETSLNFVSPVYKLMISSVARYMNQNPKLYSDIQIYNKENLKVHDTFIEVSREFNKYVEEGDEKSFISTIESTQEYFWDNAHKWQVYTDKIIFLLSKQVEQIKENIGKKCSFENIYSWEIKEETISKYKDETIFLASWEELLLDEWRVFQ